MKPLLLILTSLFMLLVAASAQDLQDKKVVFWPRFSWTDTEFEILAKERLKEGDHIITSYFVGLKDGFRSSNYSIDKKKVLLHFPTLPGAPEMEDFLNKKQNGIGGQYFEVFNAQLSYYINQSNFENILAKGNALHSRQIFAIDYDTARKPANLKLLTPKVEHIALALERALTAKRKTVVSFIEKTKEKIHALNPEIKIWITINLLSDQNNPDDVISFLEATQKDTEGFIIVFEYSKENTDAASELLKRLRPES